MKFFTSDEHYGHRRIIDFCKRPFADIYEMREFLISQHNMRVAKGDLTVHAGDMFWRTMSVDEAIDILNQLNGQHILVLGNHDELVEENERLRSKFVKVVERLYLNKTAFAPKMVIDHYAGRVWRGSHNGTYQLYGHSHAALPEVNTLSFDIGVDGRPDYAPWSETEIVAKMKVKKAAGAADPMSKAIIENPWDKAEGAQALYPAPPQIPQAVWDTLKESERQAEAATGSGAIFKPGRCTQ